MTSSSPANLNIIHMEEGENERIEKNDSYSVVRRPHLLMVNSVAESVKQRLSPSLSHRSIVSSITTSETSSDEGNHAWPNSHYGRNYVIGLITIFYAVTLIVYNVILSLWFWNLDESNADAVKRAHNQFTGYSYYVYMVSYAFFIYCYVLILLKPRRWEFFRKIVHKFFPNLWKCSLREKERERVMPEIGCLYLRYGAVIFGIVTAVFFVYSASLHTLYFEADVLTAVFIIVQTHFVYCSSTMFDTKRSIIFRFGTMHLAAVNLINAFQFIFEKGQSNQKSLGKVFKINKTASVYLTPITTTTAATSAPVLIDFSSNYSSEENDIINSTLIRIARAAAAQIVTASDGKSYIVDDCDKKIECILGSFTKVFYTAVIEYSLIASAIFFIVWHNIERIQEHELTHTIQKKSTIRINCSKMVIGLFAGYGFVIGTFVSMVLFYGYSGQSKYFEAANVYNITDIIQHCLGFLACVFALWRIRLLQFNYHDPHSHDPHHAAYANQELLDMILLAIGLIGELLFSVSGLMGIYGTRRWEPFSVALVAAHISRIVQAIFQCFLICVASKLKINQNKKCADKPGKQTITFLIILNIAIFIMNLFESDKVGTSSAVVEYYGNETWVFLVRTFSPLTVFYRFHSSVCLAEIWKNTYASKH